VRFFVSMVDGFLVGVVSVTVVTISICIRRYYYENNLQVQNENSALHQEVKQDSQIDKEREKRIAEGFKALNHGCKNIADLRKEIETAKANSKKKSEGLGSKPSDGFEIKNKQNYI